MEIHKNPKTKNNWSCIARRAHSVANMDKPHKNIDNIEDRLPTYQCHYA